MTRDISLPSVHPKGEAPEPAGGSLLQGVSLDSFAGPVHVEWDSEAALTPLGQLPFFIDFLKTAGLFDAFVADCPLYYTSPNAPKKRDVAGTAMLSMLSGHKRYAHIAALRCDHVLLDLLGMNKVVSEDAVRRGFAAIDKDAGETWLRRHLDYCSAPLLAEPWILDIDTTVKPLSCSRDGVNAYMAIRKEPILATIPKSPDGRAIPIIPIRWEAQGSSSMLRLLLATSTHRNISHLTFGSCSIGCLAISGQLCCAATVAAEQRGLPYLFKLRLTSNVKRMIERFSYQNEWTDTGHGWQAKESTLQLTGWNRQRRVIILRRRVKGDLAISPNKNNGQKTLSFVEIGPNTEVYEYSVLVTSLDDELVSFGQLYRDRAGSCIISNELKNQWGWGGFVTQDIARCQLAARLVALFYNWWNIFVRLVEPGRHREAITSRPLLLHAIATRVRHARQTTITVASSHAKAFPAAKALRAAACFLHGLMKNAEQLPGLHRWRLILSEAFKMFLKGRKLRSPPRLAPG